MSKPVVMKQNQGFLSTLPIGTIIAWHRDGEQDQVQSHSHVATVSADGAHDHQLNNIVKDTGGAYGEPVGGHGLGLTWPGYNGTPHPRSASVGHHSHTVTIGEATACHGGQRFPVFRSHLSCPERLWFI